MSRRKSLNLIANTEEEKLSALEEAKEGDMLHYINDR